MSVDIDATVEATADAGGRLMTVLTRPPQRALDLALVADGAPSMDIWAGTFDELERLLAQTGAFRSVTRWTLRLSGDAVQLESRDGRAQPPRRLIDPTGRRLVLLATDGRDKAWYSAAPWDTLDAWCASMPTALLQVLPQHYWATTAVGDPYLTATALRPAAPNTEYVRRLAWWADDPGGVPLPVVTLSPQAMETWAQVVAGGTAWATGITAVPPARESAPSADDGADPLMLVNDFRSRASRGAQRLARLLASTETLSVPLIEVLQDRLAPETGVLERAEVLASGMLTQNRTADGQALFRYRPGISEILRRGATTFEEWDTYAAVSQYLEDRHRLGGPLRALVADPAGTAELDAAGAPFAALHESLAVRLGLRDPTANQTATSATSGPSESEDPASGEAERVLHDEAGNLLLDEAGDVLPSEAAADIHDEVDLREHAPDATVGETRQEALELDVQPGVGVQVGEGNTQIIYNYDRLTWTDRVTPSPLLSVSGMIDSPYRGLSAFEERDAALFFGREAATAQLLARMSQSLDNTGLLVVSGASGVGKSSILRAGVLPRVRSTGLAAAPEAASWPCMVFSPGSAPLDELALRVASLAGVDAIAVRRSLDDDPEGFALTTRQATLTWQPGSVGNPESSAAERHLPLREQQRLLLLVDQFEQLFTYCADEEQRLKFIVALHAAATAKQGPKQTSAALVVLGVRADFEARCADYPELASAVQNRYLVTAMTRVQLRMAITEPAKVAGSSVDNELADFLLDDARTPQFGAAGTGILPLLSYALDQAWRSRTGDALTLADYERTGGIEGAVANSAQRTYDRLTSRQQVVAREVFIQLAAGRVARADLTAGKNAAGAQDVETVLEAFATERLLILDVDSVEISNEVLLTAWPLLRDTWLTGIPRQPDSPQPTAERRGLRWWRRSR